MKKLLLILSFVGLSLHAAIRWDEKNKRYYTTMKNLPSSFNRDKYCESAFALDCFVSIISEQPRANVLAALLEMMTILRRMQSLEHQVLAKDIEHLLVIFKENKKGNVLDIWEKMINGKL